MRRIVALIALSVGLLVGCSSGPDAPAPQAASGTAGPGAAAGQRFPDLVGVEVSRSGSGYTFAVTVSSPYDTAQRYADAFRVRAEDGTVYGVNELTHDHASEQPFTRSLSGVQIPAGVTNVVVEGRDQANGWGGKIKILEEAFAGLPAGGFSEHHRFLLERMLGRIDAIDGHRGA